MSKPALSVAGPWPRLSDDLPLHDPRECAGCGGGKDLLIWQEHDTADNPEPLYFVLCQRCSTEVIEWHQRLYRHLQPNEPAPGVMPICLNCVHRAGFKCWHPQSRLRGGRGLKLDYPSPTTAHLYYGGGKGEWIKVYPGMVYACAGKELAGGN